MKSQKIKIINKQGHNISGLLNIGKNRKLIIICNGYDDVVSPIQSERFYSKLFSTKNNQLISLPLIKHNLTGNGDVDQVVSSINI